MEEKNVMVVNKKGKYFFSDLDEALSYIRSKCADCSSRIMRKVEDKWIPVTTIWPQSNL